MLVCYPNCEELIIPESYLKLVNESDLNEEEIQSSLKRIIIKHSNSTQPSKYGTLKFALQGFFSKATISFDEIRKDELQFATLPSSNRTIIVDCYEDVLFKKIESTEKHFKVMDNSLIKNRIRNMKIEFAQCIISNNYSKFAIIDNSLNMLEGLKRNKELMLQTIHQAIENYHDIFTNDQLYQEITERFDACLSTIEGEYFSEFHFSKYYSELETLFHQMVQVIEDNGYPSKVLFNEQWFNEQIVELYGYQSEEVQVYEDSQEEMEKAIFALMLDEEETVDIEIDDCEME
ncbi:predicted protein [Naegleria gruberi]|uniref:Predicted protein n=1 Tax=Naegleria gruberi TaxID=5762 RepID=D2VHE8_NAEGR|nr:uncharacterized protein NAEGRDRAFT_68191 [Naegleria gruberi]EFC43789.1 predicted protein [Naegleria gruberi]|eukprot:XP_002676533.1 predicted protein [Naegleria gruberi strain NEG-M]